MNYLRQADRLLQQGGQAERKQLLRALVGEVKLLPQDLEVRISYHLPETIMNGSIAGGGFEPPTFKGYKFCEPFLFVPDASYTSCVSMKSMATNPS
jgi:hypothetical protein